MDRVVVIGGGISGLSLAYLLQKRSPSLDIVVLEAGGRLGGKIWTDTVDGFLCEWGVNGFLDNRAKTLELAAELSLQPLRSNDAARKRFIFSEGRLRSLPESPGAFIGLISHIEVARRFGAEGVGLYRTEFPYMARSDFPDRDDQFGLYRRVVAGFSRQPVTIRTLDIGGDKALPYFAPPEEDNPFMGWCSVRVSLDNRDIFRTQIEAILMAGQHGPVRLLFPMISSLDGVQACREVIMEARRNLERAGVPHAADLPVGVMIEVPAAVGLMPRLALEVDFFALGANDLIQYLLAGDRNNPLVSKYYDPLHPTVY